MKECILNSEREQFRMTKPLFLLLLLLLSASCSNFHFEKRKYQKGFYCHWNKLEKKSEDHPKKELKFAKTKGIEFTNRSDSKSNDEIANQILVFENDTIPKQEITSTGQIKQLEEKALTQEFSRSEYKESPLELSKINTNERTSSSSFIYFFIASLIPLFYSYKRSRSISVWAKINKKNARYLIVIFSVIATVSAVLLGSFAVISISPWMHSLAFLGLIVSAIIYIFRPKDSDSEKGFYWKTFSFRLFNFSGLFGAFSVGASGLLKNYHHLSEWNILSGMSGSETELINDPMIMHPGLAILISLALLTLLCLAIYGIGVLSCNLSCSGQAVLGGFVLFGGSFIAFFLFLFAVFNLFKRESKREKKFIPHALIGAAILVLLGSLILYAG